MKALTYYLVSNVLRGSVYLATFIALTLPIATFGQTARVQLVHASPDSALSVVDVYFDGVLQKDDLEFASGTPFFDVTSGNHLIAIAEPTSTSASDALGTFAVTFAEGGSYHVVAAGVLDATKFPSNPDGIDTGFKLYVADGALESSAGTDDDFVFRLFNAVPDAPAVDFFGVTTSFVGRLLENVPYGSFSLNENGPVESDVGARLVVAGTSNILYENRINFTTHAREANLGIFTGFLEDPSSLAAQSIFADGTIEPGTTVTALGQESEGLPSEFQLIVVYPNPFNPSTSIRYELSRTDRILLVVHDQLGREVARLVEGQVQAGIHTATWNPANDVSSGVYFITLSAGDRTGTKAAVLLR